MYKLTNYILYTQLRLYSFNNDIVNTYMALYTVYTLLKPFTLFLHFHHGF